MKFKLDENLEPGLAALLQQERHDVATVLGQGLSGRPDTKIYEVCWAEGRTLITMEERTNRLQNESLEPARNSENAKHQIRFATFRSN